VPFYQLDASAIVKRYVIESGSGWVRGLATSASWHPISIAEVTRVEVASALGRREREGAISAREKARLLGTFEAHCAARYRLVSVDHHVVDQAVELIGRHRLRAYDAIQLATAVVVNQSLVQSGLPPLIFVSADDELLLAAGAEGLATENPIHHS
jgi:predicted nucleic acid-binding protein